MEVVEFLFLKSFEKKFDFCFVGWLVGFVGVCVFVGIGGFVFIGVLFIEVDFFGDIVDFWREGMDKDLGIVNLK